MPLPKDALLEDRYRIEQMLARGGMGAIYQGFDTNLNIRVAIKENFFQTPQSVRQFQQEAQILARLHHPNLPRVIHHFSHNSHQYLVMDFIEGQDLWELVKTQGHPLPEEEALHYIMQVCDAVDYLHRQTPPIIHRDIKPQNIKITPNGQAMLVDFGIAKIVDDGDQTSTGARGVTPGFSPPEQYSGEGTTPVSDVFSLGATLYAVLTGKKPPNSVSLLVKWTTFQPPDKLNAKLTHQVSQAVLHAMQPLVPDRPQSVAEWKKELEAILAGPTEARPDADETAPPVGRIGGWLIGPAGESHKLPLGIITLGRASSCDIQLQDRKASRLHARLRFDGQNYTVFDAGSANGTYVNEHPVSRNGYPVKFGNRIRIGDTIFLLRPTASGNVASPLPASPVDELAGTAYDPESTDVDRRPSSRPISVGQRPVSGPVPKSGSGLPASGPLVPQSLAAAPAQQPAGKSSLWLGLGLILLLLLVFATGSTLFFAMQQRNNSSQANVDQIIAAAVAATEQARNVAANVATSDVDARATLVVLAGTATSAAESQAQIGETPAIDTEATIIAAVAATEQARATATPAPPRVSSDRLPVATNTPLPTATAVPPTIATPTLPPTASATPRPTATAIRAAPMGIFQDFESNSTWQRGDEANGELTRSTDQSYQGDYAGQLSYNFATSGNDYVVFLQNRQLAGAPNALSVYVYGDGSGHFLNAWIKDSQGQSWQMNFGRVSHTGWQQMTALLSPDRSWPSGPISGTDNGLIDYPISFQGIVLDDASDSYSGRGTIFIDNFASQAGESLPAASATPQPTARPIASATPVNNGLYILAVAGQHRYETWGAPNRSDLCDSYRNNDFNDKIHMKGFNLELSLENNSTVKVADNWTPTFTTAKGKSVQVCYYGYAGSGPPAGATTFMTFFTVVDGDDYVRAVRLEVNGNLLQICLDAGGAQTTC